MAADPARPFSADNRPPQLIFRFAVYTGVVLMLAGVAIFWLVQRDVTRRAEKTIEAQAHQVVEATLSRGLRRADFLAPVSPRRRKELDGVFRDRAFVVGVVRVSLIGRDGTITYSTTPAIIGETDRTNISRVLREGTRRQIVSINVGGSLGRQKVLRTVVPVRVTSGTRPVGAVALAQDYESVRLQTSYAGGRLAVILFIALLALYASLFPILRRVTAELAARNRRLSDQAVELSKLAAVVESSDDAIVATDLNGVVVSWNKGAERLFGYPAHEMVGRPMSVVAPPDRMHEFGNHVRELAKGNRLTHVETVRLHRDGRPLDVSLTLSPIEGDDGKPVGFSGIVRDITEQKRQQAQRDGLLVKERLARAEAEAARAEAEAAQTLLTEQNERLRELDRLKDEFVSLVSHELRTPLTSISGYLELLLDGEAGDLTDEQSRFLRVVDRNSERLLHLVGDLLFLAQVDSGKLTIDLTEVELDSLVAECVEAARPFAVDKNVQLRSDVLSVPPLIGDRARLAQLLDNLVSNAIKFTPDGGEVELRLLSVDGEAVLEVRDTGIGIPAEEQSQLFERFFRSSTATEHAIQGTGLGLSIARAIVERHRGRIEIESAPGAGTAVRVSIPIQAPDRASLHAQKVPA